MKNRTKILVFLVAIAATFGIAHATTTVTTAKVGIEQGALRGYVANGGSFDVESGGELDIESGGSFKLAGTAVSATAAELNIMDGVTADASELNIMDGVTSSTAELNILDGVTSTASELNILDGVTATASNLNILASATISATEINQKEVVGALSDISGTTSVEFACPAAGDISSIVFTVGSAGTPGGAGSTSIASYINGVAVTGGSVDVASTATAFTKYTASPSAANTCAVGDVIAVQSDGTASNSVPVYMSVIIDL